MSFILSGNALVFMSPVADFEKSINLGEGWSGLPLRRAFIFLFSFFYYISTTFIMFICFNLITKARSTVNYYQFSQSVTRLSITEFISIFIWFLSIFVHGQMFSICMMGGLIPFFKLPYFNSECIRLYRKLNNSLTSIVAVRYMF